MSRATSRQMTALQFPTSSDGRDTWTDEARLAELEPWHRLVVSPGGQDDVDARCEAGRREQLVEDRATIALLQRDLAWLRGQHEKQTEAMSWLREKLDEAQGHLDWLRGQHDHLQGRVDADAATLARLRAKLAHKSEVIARLRGRLRDA